MSANKIEKIERLMPLIFIVFFSVGVLMFSLPQTHALFLSITPLTLLMLALLVFMRHRPWNFASVVLFLFIILASIYVEARGVASGTLFGEYEYLTTLNPKFADVPVIIGVNWLIVSYGAAALTAGKFKNNLLRVLIAALLMVLYDLVLEWAAPVMLMWTFAGYPPLRNFVMWFALGLIFQALLVGFRIATDNRIARALYIIQMFFFAVIALIGEFIR